MSAPAQPIPHRQDPAPVQLTIPPKLYGRERELAALTGAFAEVGAGHGLVLLVPGHSGSGKTALVQALREPVREKNGFFLEGKFNQYQQDVALFAIRQALGQLAKELLSASAPECLRWKTQILQAVGGLGRLLTELVPDLEQLLGPQPAVPDISPYEAPHRFATVLRNFLTVFCRAEHPVVLFVDDWQWADAASLAVLRQLQVNTSLRYLLVVASYRDDEVDANHPFTTTVEELRLQSVPTRILEVRDLGSAEVQELLTDTLPPATEDLEGLTRFIQDSTRGNPFFMRAFLEFLHACQALWFDQPGQVWRWKAATLEDQGGPGGVVALFGHKLRQLPVACRELLSLAACIGNRFDLETLALVSECSPAECLALLGTALDQRLVLPLAGGVEEPWPEPDNPPGGFLFLHDRVQQAAYGLTAADEIPGLQLRIGRLLVSRLTPGQLDERLLEVTGHLNAGRSLVVAEAEQVKLVELNVAAGRKARRSTAYHAALQFHRVAGGVLAQPGFAGRLLHLHPDLVLQFFKDWAESEFLEGDRMEAERCIQEAIAHARTPLEQADALCILIVQYTLLARYPEAIAAGRRALAALGISLPETDFETARDAEIERVRQRLGSRSVAALRDAPVMTDPAMLMATRLLITMGPPCYRSHQRLWSVIVPRVVDLTLQYGPVPQVGYSHPAFGGLLGWVANDHATAREFAELATRLMTEVFSAPSDQSVFYLMIGSSSRHWFQHLAAASQDYLQAWETGLRSGNLQYAAYAFGHNMYCRFYQGIPLDVLIQESRQSLAFSRTRTNQWAIDLLEGGLQVFGGLAAAESGGDSAQSWSEAEYLNQLEAHHNIQVSCIYRVLQASSLLLLGDYERALAVSDEAEPLLYTVGTQGLLPWPEHVFTRLLLLAILHPEAEASRQAAWRGEINRMVDQLQIWATHCPENYRHKHAFARAEAARLDDQPAEALRFYDEAIEAARAGRFTQWEGLANERAACLAHAGGQERLAHLHWQNAYFCHHRWGAVAKLRRMEQEFLAELSAGPLYAAPPTPLGDGSPDRAALADRLEPHLQALRAQAAWLARERAQLDHPEQVEDLTQATQLLREEVAERKRVEAELEHHREQLEREIQERTTALATSQKLARQFEAQTHEIEEQRSLLAETQAATLNLMEDVVSTRNRAEQANVALSASEASLIHAQQIARVGNWDWNIVTDELYWSAQVFVLFGISENDANRTYERFLRGVHPEDRERTHQAVEDAVAGRTPYNIEHRVLWPDGTVLVMHERGEVTRDAEGRALHMTGTVQDITERKQAEATLQESESRFRATFEQAAVGMAQVGLDGHWLRVNERLCNLVGYSAEELLRLTFQDITHPDDLDADLNHVRELLAGEIPNYSMEKRYVRKDGAEIWINLTVALVRDAAGQPLYFIAVIEDISGHKRAEAAVQLHQERLQRTQAMGQVGSWEYSLESGKIWGSDEGFRILGLPYENEDVAIEIVEACIPDRKRVQQALRDLIAHGQPYNLEYEVRPANGAAPRIVNSIAALEQDDRGNPVKVVGAILDITDRKEAEAALRVSEEQFRTLAESIPQLAWIARADGYIYWYNQRWYDYTGTTLAQMEGWGWQSVHDPQALPKIMEQWKNGIAAGQPVEMEFPLRGADGQFRTFLTRAQPLKNAEGQILKWFGTNTDVDELKRTEEEVRRLNAELEQRVRARTAQLEAANHELEAFSYSVSHDLRAPLRSIDGFSRILLEDCHAKLDAESQDNLARVRAASQRMGQLIDDLLELSRLSRDKIRRAPLDLSAMAREVADELQKAEPERRVEFVLEPGLMASADAGLLRAVLRNLLGNAWKFTGKQDRPKIEFGRVIQDGVPAFFVHDNGVGFDIAYAHKMFGAFQRLHTTEEFPGTGIGLATVQRVIHRHGGRVWAEGQVNHGATLYFSLSEQLKEST